MAQISLSHFTKQEYAKEFSRQNIKNHYQGNPVILKSQNFVASIRIIFNYLFLNFCKKCIKCTILAILFIYFWLCWVFLAAWVFLYLQLVGSVLQLWFAREAVASLGAEDMGFSSFWYLGSAVVVLELQSTGLIIVGRGIICSAAYGIFPDLGLNLCVLHLLADSLPLSHQGNSHFKHF